MLNSLNSKEVYKIKENLKSGQSSNFKTVSRVKGVEDWCNFGTSIFFLKRKKRKWIKKTMDLRIFLEICGIFGTLIYIQSTYIRSKTKIVLK